MEVKRYAARHPAPHREHLHATVAAPDGARRRLAQRVAVMSRPERYPEAVGTIEAIETHMSWVFLTETHAYKLKKPLVTRFFDHSTSEARRRACLLEVELNRRLAADVYLGVVPLSASPHGLRIEGPGAPVDWLVKMRRLPRERMLDAAIARRAVRGGEVDRLAQVLVGFYAVARREPRTAAVYRSQLLWDVEAKRRSLEQRRYGLEGDEVRAATSRLRRWIDRHGELLDFRAGAVVEAHGDLRPEHVCLEPVPVVIDCLEFSRELRLLDPISELSFLALECRRLGAGWIGDQLLAEYAQRAHDAVSPQLVTFYQSYHAVVRAAVAVWHLDDEALDGESRSTDAPGEPWAERWRDRARVYLDLARNLA